MSEHNADEDYIEGLARLGAEELWIFDPELRGPTATGGPYVLQIWRRKPSADVVDMERSHAGDHSAYSPVLDAWAITMDDERRLRIADDDRGEHLWLTQAEAAEAEGRRLRALVEKE